MSKWSNGKKITSWQFVTVTFGVLAVGSADAVEPARVLLRSFKQRCAWQEKGQPLAGTRLLELQGDIASELVAGVDKFLLREIEQSVQGRPAHWSRELSSAEAYDRSIEPNRKRLARILGMRDARAPFDAPGLVATTARSALVAKSSLFDVFEVRWPVLSDPDPSRSTVVVYGEGLLMVPRRERPLADIVAIPDAGQTPEEIAGLTGGAPADSQFARRLAECGCRVLVPTLISREMQRRTRPNGSGGANLTHREYVYRSAFELGRHLLGYEVQKVLAGVDWFTKEAGAGDARIGVVGLGEGGAIALYSAALDTRIDAAYVSGYFGPREGIWQQPIDRNVYSLLREFGDAELASMVVPRALIVDNAGRPTLNLPSEGGAPASLIAPTFARVRAEYERAVQLCNGDNDRGLPVEHLVLSRVQDIAWPGKAGLSGLVKSLSPDAELAAMPAKLALTGTLPDAEARQTRQIEQLDQFNQLLLRESAFVRKEFMGKLDTSSVEKYATSVEEYRTVFYDEVVGRFDNKVLPFNPRTRKAYETSKWVGYEVVLDVYPDVIAYGVLLLPRDLRLDGSDKRPVVVCQHGLEGRPQDVIEGDHRAYHDFAAKLCERGFITFAPQNLYIFRDRFRTLQRKANPLGKTLFSIIVPQHQQIVDWLQSLPYVDPDRVAFYGLSYGGKTAMRVPPLVTDYCLSICSADFNEWVRKNASTRHPFSYVWTGEYEIFEFDLGSTFNYAEMAALVCPRPFMVERGHFDGVGWDEWVSYEFAKVRNLYQAQLHIGDRCEMESFVGPHTINGQGTFRFLHKHLDWPEPGGSQD